MKCKNQYIGCTGDDNCYICSVIDKPGYEKVKVNLSKSRIIPNCNHLAPVALPLPSEVTRLMGSARKTNGFVNNPDGLKQSPFSCIYGGEDTSNKVICPSCGGGNGRFQLKVFKCLLPEIKSCTVDRKVEGIQMCKDCNRFQAK